MIILEPHAAMPSLMVAQCMQLPQMYISYNSELVAPKKINSDSDYGRFGMPYLNNLNLENSLFDLSYDGGGSKCPPPLFLFVKTIEKVIRLCTVLRKKIY